jgi:predicted hydrolase (HD superfamily)
MGIDEDIVDAIRMHNEMATQKPRTTVLQHALAAGETITGLINATALVYPNKDILLVKTQIHHQKNEGKSLRCLRERENIMECEAVGLNLEEFVAIALEAMQSIPNYNDLNK